MMPVRRALLLVAAVGMVTGVAGGLARAGVRFGIDGKPRG